jgi:hypothetical protein
VLYSNFNTLPANDPRRVDVRGQTLRAAADILCAGTGLTGIAVTATCPVAVPLGANEYSFRVPRTNERRPDARYTTNVEVSNGAWSYYHGLQVEINKRLSNNLSFTTNYTWSKAIDTNSEATFVGTGDTNSNGPNTRLSRALSLFHTPHRFTMFLSYQNPFFDKRRDIVGQLLGGWYTSIVYKRAYGNPFTVTATGVDLNLDGSLESRPVLINPNILGNIINNPEFFDQSIAGYGFSRGDRS